MPRNFFIGGNWKTMVKTRSEAEKLASDLVEARMGFPGVEIAVFPSDVHLTSVQNIIGNLSIGLGSQNISAYRENNGKEEPNTGELSIDTLADCGGRYAIIGHSEQRQHYGETDKRVNARLDNVLRYNRLNSSRAVVPVVCIGETLEQRESGQTNAVIKSQLEGALENHSGYKLSELGLAVIAYEPVWAIGTGKTATPEQAQDVHMFIRELLYNIAIGYPSNRLDSQEFPEGIRIIYGGSVNPKNALEIFQQPDIDGGLIGGASLKAETFAPLAEMAGKAYASRLG